MSRQREEFTGKVRVAAWERAGGKCEYAEPVDLPQMWSYCAKKLRPGDIHYDHVIPWAISRDSSLGNCQCLCKAHHLLKTTTADVPTIAKTKRVEANHIGATKPRSRLSSSRYRKTMSGLVVDKATGEAVGNRRHR